GLRPHPRPRTRRHPPAAGGRVCARRCPRRSARGRARLPVRLQRRHGGGGDPVGTPDDLLAAALHYAELGYRGVPCVPGGKAPLTAHGSPDAPTDPDRIERWWAQPPGANVALATEGLVVSDGGANPWPGGDPERVLDLSAGPMALTPGGGSHRLFRQPA